VHLGRRIIGSGIAGFAVMAAPAVAKTAAGTLITNTAKATYDLPNGGRGSIDSNTASVKVDEVLDVAVTSLDSADVAATPGAVNRVLTFKVSNAGNGQEAFKLVARDDATGDDFNPKTTSIVIDSNNNGTYDPGVDAVYSAGANDPALAPDGTVTLFVLSSIPSTTTNGQRGEADLVATAATGSGTAGTVFAGKGDGGGDAVVGSTTASATAHGYYAVSAATVALAKSASVTDPFGGSTHVPGSVITYTLVATVSGAGSVPNLTISDAVPSGTAYQAGSMTLDGSLLTDGADTDAGEVVTGNLAVRLGSVAAGANRTVTFKVKVD